MGSSATRGRGARPRHADRRRLPACPRLKRRAPLVTQPTDASPSLQSETRAGPPFRRQRCSPQALVLGGAAPCAVLSRAARVPCTELLPSERPRRPGSRIPLLAVSPRAFGVRTRGGDAAGTESGGRDEAARGLVSFVFLSLAPICSKNRGLVRTQGNGRVLGKEEGRPPRRNAAEMRSARRPPPPPLLSGGPLRASRCPHEPLAPRAAGPVSTQRPRRTAPFSPPGVLRWDTSKVIFVLLIVLYTHGFVCPSRKGES